MVAQKGTSKYQMRIGGMHCSFCASSISQSILSLKGVKEVNVSLAHEEALVGYDPNKVETWQIDEALRGLGYTIRDPNKLRSFEEEEAELRGYRNRLLGSAVLTFAQLGLMLLVLLGLKQNWFPFVMVPLALGNVFGFGFPILNMSYNSIRRKILNQHVLMETAAVSGLIGGFLELLLYHNNSIAAQFFTVATFIVSYHLLGGFASLKVRTATSQAVRKLLSLQPPTARVVRNGRVVVLPINKVKRGDTVLVKPGEGIPVDGRVVKGHSTVNESIVTGESMPVEKKAGSGVIGGSVNEYGVLYINVTKIGEESFLHKIASYVEEARAMKPGVMQLLDTVLKYFVPGVIAASIIAVIIWIPGMWLLTGRPDIPTAIFAALSVLVMGYPCALGMATPLAMIRGGGMAAEKGILFRSSEAFTELKSVDTVMLDKTGTLTAGKPSVSAIKPVGNYNADAVLSLAAAAENPSEHPIAKAIVDRARLAKLKIGAVRNFRANPGSGVKCLYNNKLLEVGRLETISSKSSTYDTAKKIRDQLENTGQTVVAVSYDKNVVGLICVADKIKDDAAETVNKFKKFGIEPMMITGDNGGVARLTANKIGIAQVYASFLPHAKADKIRELEKQGHHVMMVGDGINDAPSLMLADIGVAMGAGTDIAMESADVIIIGNKLESLIDAYEIGLNSYSKTKQNLAVAFVFNGIGIPVAVTGLVPPILAMVAMAISITLVVSNSFGGKLIQKMSVEKAASSKAEFEVPTIHCKTCLANILSSVSGIEGVESVKKGSEKNTIIVTYRGNESKIIDKIDGNVKELGHTIFIVNRESKE